jgi:hypothetical protein
LSDDEPKKGDLITRKGGDWVVVDVVDVEGCFQVRLRPAVEPDRRRVA